MLKNLTHWNVQNKNVEAKNTTLDRMKPHHSVVGVYSLLPSTIGQFESFQKNTLLHSKINTSHANSRVAIQAVPLEVILQGLQGSEKLWVGAKIGKLDQMNR